MGILYSTWSFLASYTQWPVQKLQANKIRISSQKLTYTLRLKQLKLQDKTKQLQKQLLDRVLQSLDCLQLLQKRSLPIEQALMQQIVINSELLAAYQQIVRCAQVIKNEADTIENDIGNISKECQLAIFTIIYANKALDLQDIISLNEFVPSKLQSAITEKQISEPLREYVQSGKVASPEALNIYALQMCYRNQISLDKFNQVGHKFRYNPSHYKQSNRESKSSQMFAISFVEDIEHFGNEFNDDYQKDAYHSTILEQEQPNKQLDQQSYECWGDQTQKQMVESMHKKEEALLN